MITLTRQQSKAVQVMSTKFNNRDPITVIAGYAGSGKSSIINYFIENNDLMDNTRFATFTGKASLVLQNKGLPATTIHKLIYDTFMNRRTGKMTFVRKEFLDPSIKLIVIDEVSMVPNNILRDLAFFEIPIIALGDPGQLEPIGEDNGLLKSPDCFLEEIHRQAEDSEIIQFSMHVRNGGLTSNWESGNNVKIISREEVSSSVLAWADQILCGRNTTRYAINSDVRKHYGYSGLYPEVGEKVICLKNYWDSVNDSNDPLINGTIGTVTRIQKPQIDDPDSLITDDVRIQLETDYSEDEWVNISVDPNIFKGFAPISSIPPRFVNDYHEFDFGYAITAHKAQGSEFEKVLVFEERLGGGDHSRWLYTAATRPTDKLVVVKAS